jgi:hypothetical protein
MSNATALAKPMMATTQTTARRTPAKAAKPSKANAAKLIPYEERGGIFETFTPEQFTHYQTLVGQMRDCPTYAAILEIIALANSLEAKVWALLKLAQNGRAETPTALWLAKFGESEAWDTLTALRVNLSTAAGIVECCLPEVKTAVSKAG